MTLYEKFRAARSVNEGRTGYDESWWDALEWALFCWYQETGYPVRQRRVARAQVKCDRGGTRVDDYANGREVDKLCRWFGLLADGDPADGDPADGDPADGADVFNKFHAAWSASVGRPGYDKGWWKECEARMFDGRRLRSGWDVDVMSQLFDLLALDAPARVSSDELRRVVEHPHFYALFPPNEVCACYQLKLQVGDKMYDVYARDPDELVRRFDAFLVAFSPVGEEGEQ